VTNIHLSYWRSKAAPIITRVLEETKGKPDAEIRKALHDAYPFGPRKYHPYKIWLDEIKRQRNGGRGVVVISPEELRTAFLRPREAR
jgi:hypothetical protein